MDKKSIDALSLQIFKYAKDNLIVNFRFLDVALSKIKEKPAVEVRLPYCDYKNLYYNPTEIIKKFKAENAYIQRLILHCLFHCIFNHGYFAKNKEFDYWSLATDIAVENIILSLNVNSISLNDDFSRQNELKILNKNSVKLTAEGIYKYFLTNGLSDDGKRRLVEIFTFDDHKIWQEELDSKLFNEFLKLSERIVADIGSFSKNNADSKALSENLEEVTKERYDYSDILRRFSVMGEDMGINDDEFDYIYYTYGLSTYKNMPLIEPLEYKDVKKVKEFAIAIDTSASTKGSIVRNFLNKTYSILKSSESFFTKVNIHIILCDNQIRQDIKITSNEEFEDFIKNGKLTGFGSTDFRPVFTYVAELLDNGEFENIKGLIYFTDGYGIYPEYKPPFDSMFVFLDEDEKRFVPPWAIKVILEKEEFYDN